MEKILRIFTGATEEKDEQSKMEKLNVQFCEMAKELLYGGYFLVNKTKRIYLDDIEFYYHEEGEESKGKLKDPIMYHTNDHEGHDIKRELPYYNIGRLNLHQSGIDITFENEDNCYRASCLIRGYRIDNNSKIETRSTYLYYDMLYMGVPIGKPIEIEWITEDLFGKNEYKPKEGIYRQNVKKYEKDENGCYKKDCKGKYIKTTEQCDRKWRFKRNM